MAVPIVVLVQVEGGRRWNQLPMAAEGETLAGVGGVTETWHKQQRQLDALATGHCLLPSAACSLHI